MQDFRHVILWGSGGGVGVECVTTDAEDLGLIPGVVSVSAL